MHCAACCLSTPSAAQECLLLEAPGGQQATLSSSAAVELLLESLLVAPALCLVVAALLAGEVLLWPLVLKLALHLLCHLEPCKDAAVLELPPISRFVTEHRTCGSLFAYCKCCCTVANGWQQQVPRAPCNCKPNLHSASWCAELTVHYLQQGKPQGAPAAPPFQQLLFVALF